MFGAAKVLLWEIEEACASRFQQTNGFVTQSCVGMSGGSLDMASGTSGLSLPHADQTRGRRLKKSEAPLAWQTPNVVRVGLNSRNA